MNRDCDLAIVIPFYKIEYFEKVLESLRDQTNQNFNLYIGNDASPQDPAYLIEKYQSIISNYKKYDQNIGGISLTKHWDRCIKNLVQGEEWIMILCDDDFVDPTIVNEFYKYATTKNHVIKFATRIVSEDGSKILGEFTNKTYENSIAYTVEKILNKKRSTLSEHIFRRKKYDQYGFKDFKLAFGSDDVAWVDFTGGKNMTCINDAFVNYRKSVLSISNNQDPILKRNKIIGIIQSYTYILENYSPLMTRIQKRVLIKRVYQYVRAIFSNDKTYQLKFAWLMLRKAGIIQTINIIRENKNYYENPT